MLLVWVLGYFHLDKGKVYLAKQRVAKKSFLGNVIKVAVGAILIYLTSFDMQLLCDQLSFNYCLV